MSNRTSTGEHAIRKFSDPEWTAKGERRATVPFTGLDTLWLNTGTLCNIACANCYIESTPKNDALVYMTRDEAALFLNEAKNLANPPREIGFTGGEPFMNPDMIGMMEDGLAAGFRLLVLTNAMKPMQHRAAQLLDLSRRFPGRISVRVSLDHYERAKHEDVRGERTWQPALDGLTWLSSHGFDVSVAGRLLWSEDEAVLRAGYARTFARHSIALDTCDPARLMLFPEMEPHADVPEISEGCWRILNKRPESVMCASSRMVVKRKGAARPVVISCTLLPYEPEFELGHTLAEASRPVALNHRYCAKFCVLGGASCSAK
jgi:hypothetical protein